MLSTGRAQSHDPNHGYMKENLDINASFLFLFFSSPFLFSAFENHHNNVTRNSISNTRQLLGKAEKKTYYAARKLKKKVQK